jgi:hypothetical protein
MSDILVGFISPLPSYSAVITNFPIRLERCSLEYTDIPLVFMPHQGHCYTLIRRHCCILGHCCTSIPGHCLSSVILVLIQSQAIVMQSFPIMTFSRSCTNVIQGLIVAQTPWIPLFDNNGFQLRGQRFLLLHNNGTSSPILVKNARCIHGWAHKVFFTHTKPWEHLQIDIYLLFLTCTVVFAGHTSICILKAHVHSTSNCMHTQTKNVSFNWAMKHVN